MKTRKIPMRKCLASNEHFPKKELLRIVKTPEGKVIIDPTGKANGRGAYIKLSQENVHKLIKSQVLCRALETEVEPEVYEELLEMINKN